MEKNNICLVKCWIMIDVIWMVLVIGLYVVVMLVLFVFSFGVI